MIKENCDINIKIKDVSKYCIEKEFEICALELIKPQCTLVAVYRSTEYNYTIFQKHMCGFMSDLFKQNQQYLLAGDFNIDFSTKNRSSIDDQNE